MSAIIHEVTERTPSVIDQVVRELPEGSPADLFEKVTTELSKAATRVRR